jgi:hypothetical protein
VVRLEILEQPPKRLSSEDIAAGITEQPAEHDPPAPLDLPF